MGYHMIEFSLLTFLAGAPLSKDAPTLHVAGAQQDALVYDHPYMGCR
jgi:hypothetical protein